MKNLPSGWADARLECVVEILDSKRIPVNSDERKSRNKGKLPQQLFPYYGATGQVGRIDDFLFDGTHILLGEDGVPFLDPLRHKAYVVNGKFWVNNHAHVLKAISSVCDPRFISAYLNSFDYIGFVTGSTRLKLNQAAMRTIPIPIAPIDEQRRIADKLDALSKRVDLCREKLDRVPLILKRFRQAVLAAATSGALTEDWRTAEGLPCELQSFHFADALCIKNYQFPLSWAQVRLCDIAEITGGLTKDSNKQSRDEEELPYLRVANVQRGFLDLSEVKTIRVPRNKLDTLLLRPRDILFNEGGDIDKLGRGWVWNAELERCVHQNHVFRARLKNESFAPEYFSWYGNSRGYDYFLSRGKQTTNLASINKSVLSALPVPVPSPAEQHEIVRRVVQLFAFADRLEARYLTARKQVDQLTPSLLAKAFRGELVEQDPNDEPASVLLERIRAERIKTVAPRSPVPARSTRSTRQSKKATPPPTPEPAKEFGTNIPQRLLAAMQAGRDYGRAEITAASGISDIEWSWAIKQLKEEGKVRQTGERRGARYRRV